MGEPHPTEVRRLPEEGRLRVTWSDGHVGEYDYTYLRGYCPCAACQGHTNEAIRFHAPVGDVRPETIEPVGNYALSFHWSDGHGTGIYRFDFLRRICPCPACAGDPDGTPPVPRE
ncbi:MAG: gamma-butyrobetaine hydroxylase-like domain-containing protein [Thermoanaerobaculia bacterium]